MKIHLIIGILLLLSSIWGGSYALGQFGVREWQHFPIAATSFIVGAIGFGFPDFPVDGALCRATNY